MPGLIIGLAFLTEELVNSNFLAGPIARDNHMLLASLLPLAGALTAVLLWMTDQPSRWRAMFWAIVAANLLTMFVMLHKDIVAVSAFGVTTGIQDGAVQTNDAARFLTHGINPYTADYSHSSFGQFPSPAGMNLPNIAWTHYAYPPANFLLTIPLRWLQSLASWLDARFLYVAAFLIFTGWLIATKMTWPKRLMVTALTIGNPLLWLFAVAGYNDSLMLLGLVGAMLCFRRQRWLWAGVFFGLALASKQTAWVLAPLWAIWAFQACRKSAVSAPAVKKIIFGTAVMLATFILPFVVWHWSAIYDDTVRYISGAIPNSFPIAGPTLLQWLHSYHLVSSPFSAFPSYLVQLAIAIPIYIFLHRVLRRQPTLSRLLFGSAAFLLAIFLVARYSFPNYLMTVLTLAIAGYSLEDHDHVTE